MRKTMKKNHIWTIVLLVGTYIMCQAIADIGATKLVQVGGFLIPGGTFIFALTFTIRDVIHKRLGREWARAAIISAALLNILMAGYLAIVAKLPYPPFFELGEAWGAIFAIIPAITIASIVAEVVSESTDTEIYHLVKTRRESWPQWTRVLLSNAVALPLDSLVFAGLAFLLLPPLFGAEALPIAALGPIVAGQVIFKAIVTLVSMPLIYTVPDREIVLTE